jgi:hypothetical protein
VARSRTSGCAQLPRGCEPAGRYVGPLELNTRPPEVVLAGDGIPLVRYPVGYRTNPVVAAQYGLWAYGVYLRDRNSTHRRIAIHVADWLVQHQDAKGRWIYHFDFKTIGGSVTAPCRRWRRARRCRCSNACTA